jgi:uncharacterized protein YdhG (YjbR/CyaY superfamily)
MPKGLISLGLLVKENERLIFNANPYIEIIMTTSQFQNIDAYIATFPKEIQALLEQVRETIQNIAPDAKEAIKYAMPTFMLNCKNLVHFAAFKNHIGFYATPSGHLEFKVALAPYKSGKGSVQFPIDSPMPLDLIARMVQFRVDKIMGHG